MSTIHVTDESVSHWMAHQFGIMQIVTLVSLRRWLISSIWELYVGRSNICIFLIRIESLHFTVVQQQHYHIED